MPVCLQISVQKETAKLRRYNTKKTKEDNEEASTDVRKNTLN
jgi:hypothetical protein